MLTGAWAHNQPVVISSLGTWGSRIRIAHAAVAPASGAWPSANLAILVPFAVPGPTQVMEMFFVAGTSPGTANYDLGIYDDAFVRIVNLGTTAAVNTTDALLPAGGGDVTDVVLQRGRYYMAMVAAATTITARCAVNANQFFRAIGCQGMAAGGPPLPATITPASYTTAYLPMFGMTAITNIL